MEYVREADMPRHLVWIVVALLATACAAPPKPAVPVAESPVQAEDKDDAFYHTLAAELAARQGDLNQALGSYLAAMRLSDDPALAERAARLALYLGDQQAAREAGSRWQALDPDAAEPYSVLALLDLRAGNRDGALAHLRQVLALDQQEPSNAFARVATLLLNEKNAGLEVMQALVAEHAEQPAAHLALAELALQLKQPQLALEAARRAGELDRKSTDAALLQVQALLQLEQGDQAVRLLEGILKRQPDNYEVRMLYARTLLSLQRAEGAFKQFQQLAKQRPNEAPALYAAALLAIELGENDKAREHLLQLVNLGQRADEAYFYLGRIAQSEGDAKGAMRWYRRVEGDYQPEAQLRVALLLAAQGEIADARAKLQALRRDYPSLAGRTYLAEGEVLRGAGQLQQAYELYTAALAQSPDDWDLRYARALAAAEQGRVAEAEADFRALLAKRADSAQVLNALGYTLVDRTDRYQEGYELIAKAYELRPDDPAIIDSMGWAAYRLGRLEEARDFLAQAYEMAAEGEIAAHLAEVLWQLEERKRAREVLREALKKEPKNPLLLELKKRFE